MSDNEQMFCEQILENKYFEVFKIKKNNNKILFAFIFKSEKVAGDCVEILGKIFFSKL